MPAAGHIDVIGICMPSSTLYIWSNEYESFHSNLNELYLSSHFLSHESWRCHLYSNFFKYHRPTPRHTCTRICMYIEYIYIYTHDYSHQFYCFPQYQVKRYFVLSWRHIRSPVGIIHTRDNAMRCTWEMMIMHYAKRYDMGGGWLEESDGRDIVERAWKKRVDLIEWKMYVSKNESYSSVTYLRTWERHRKLLSRTFVVQFW